MYYCMVCLNCEVKLFDIKDNSIGNIYSALTQIQVTNWNQHVCFECASLLEKYQKFKLRCIRADKILSETIIMPEVGRSHLQTLQNHFKLASNLRCSEIITEDFVETNNEIKTENLNNNEMFILLSNDETKSPSYIELKQDKAQYDISDDEKSHNKRLLSISVSKDGKIVCGQETTNKPSAIHLINKNDDPQPIVPKAEILISSDDESFHSDSSWTTILNTLKRIKNKNKELTSHHKENICNTDSELKINNVPPDNKSKEHAEDSFEARENIVKNSRASVKRNVKTKCEKQKKEMYWSIHRKQKLLKKYGTLVYLTKEQLKCDLLARQHSKNYCNSRFKCKICFRGFKSKIAYDNHMVKHNPIRGNYECDNCHVRYSSRKLIINHLQSAHTVKFTCRVPKCSFVCYNLGLAIAHVVDLHKRKGENYECKFCGAKFKVSNTLSGHIYKWHRNEFKDEYFCEFCGRTFYNKQGVTVHKNKFHFNEQNDKQGPECKECNVHFASEQAWKLHLVLSRKHEVANGCKSCGKCFDNYFDLMSHKKLHRRVDKSENSRYFCQFCDFVVRNSYFYKLHLHKKHGQPKPEKREQSKPYTCEFCGDSFSLLILLKTHIMKHTGERPFKCQYCGQGFRYKFLMQAHENVHTRAEIFKCAFCEKEFLRKTSLKKHTRLHLGDTPHECMACGRAFTCLSMLQAHVRHKHEKVPYPPRKNPRCRKKKLESVAEEIITK